LRKTLGVLRHQHKLIRIAHQQVVLVVVDRELELVQALEREVEPEVPV